VTTKEITVTVDWPKIAKTVSAGLAAAFGAATAVASGPDLSVLDVGDWLAALGTGFAASAAAWRGTGTSRIAEKIRGRKSAPVADEVLEDTKDLSDLIEQVLGITVPKVGDGES